MYHVYDTPLAIFVHIQNKYGKIELNFTPTISCKINISTTFPIQGSLVTEVPPNSPYPGDRARDRCGRPITRNILVRTLIVNYNILTEPAINKFGTKFGTKIPIFFLQTQA